MISITDRHHTPPLSSASLILRDFRFFFAAAIITPVAAAITDTLPLMRHYAATLIFRRSHFRFRCHVRRRR